MGAIKFALMDIGAIGKIIIANLVMKHAPNVMVLFPLNVKDVLICKDQMILELWLRQGICLSVLNAKFRNVRTVSISNGKELLECVTNAILLARDALDLWLISVYSVSQDS